MVERGGDGDYLRCAEVLLPVTQIYFILLRNRSTEMKRRLVILVWNRSRVLYAKEAGAWSAIARVAYYPCRIVMEANVQVSFQNVTLTITKILHSYLLRSLASSMVLVGHMLIQWNIEPHVTKVIAVRRLNS